MPPGSDLPAASSSFGSAVDSQLAVIRAGLVKECEKISLEREQTLQDQNVQLRKEIMAFQTQDQAPLDLDTDIQVRVPTCVDLDTEIQDTQVEVERPEKITSIDRPAAESIDPAPVHRPNDGQGTGKQRGSESSISTIGTLEASPEIVSVAKIGGLCLAEGFWDRNAARPNQDHGFCVVDGLEEHPDEHLAESSHFWIVNPTGNLKLSWDVLGIPVLAWDLVTIPMQVFGIEDSSPMISMGWVTLIFWTLDVPVCFLTGFFDREGELIMDWGQIIKRYCKGMFSLDMLIIGSDWLSILLEVAASGSAPPFLSNMAILRALRITRFARLMRLRKLKAKWQTVEDHIDSEWTLVCLGLIFKIMSIVAVTHYVGCVFFWIGTQQIQGYDTWLDTPYVQHRRDGIVQGDLREAPWAYQYFTTVHWAITQFTPGGMHVQPQNIPERAFSIFCLLFGMVIFSSFIANVTQARMQLNKMMSKFEREMWLLRKFCRQNKISHQLTVRMRRYVDLVLIPKYNAMATKDVVLLPMLSNHLREELQTELESRKMKVHPFFNEFQKNKAAMNKICNSALVNLPVARGDVVFNVGECATHMYIVLGGVMDYIPHTTDHETERLTPARWVCEAALWTKWITQGQLQGSIESQLLGIDAKKFRGILSENLVQMQFAQVYAKRFMELLNEDWQRQGCIPDDLQESITAMCMEHNSHSGASSIVPNAVLTVIEAVESILTVPEPEPAPPQAAGTESPSPSRGKNWAVL